MGYILFGGTRVTSVLFDDNLVVLLYGNLVVLRFYH